MPKTIPYGRADYSELIATNSYFIDKTAYIAKLELISNPIFLRPRKFGKSLWCRILELYYSITHQDEFEDFFGNTYIGQHPTPNRNGYIVLHLDFSDIEPSEDIQQLRANFNNTCNMQLATAVEQANAFFQDQVEIDFESSASINLGRIQYAIVRYHLPKLYIIIDEYDNFANQLITGRQDPLYEELIADYSFFKTFFKSIKSGRKRGYIANCYITGVLPILIDDLASGYNIGTFLTLDSEFEHMLGFTQPEVDQLLDQIYDDYGFDPITRDEVNDIIKNHYDGYHFVDLESEALYNSTILMYFLRQFVQHQKLPEQLIDPNLKTELSWVRRLTDSNPTLTRAFVERLTLDGRIGYDKKLLVDQFSMYQFLAEAQFPISFFYLGMLTRQDEFYLRLPNLNIRQIFVEYFNKIHSIDLSTDYLEIMQRFVNEPNLERLFAGYWEQYISKLPEVVFNQVNENFYRVTFYELCYRHLSKWFTWNVERSYPSGKSDLEFVGKYHEQFAGLRWVIEFKYYSLAEMKRRSYKIQSFKLRNKDTEQIAGYVAGLQAEYPEAQIRQFVIYCFGNQGFRIFEI